MLKRWMGVGAGALAALVAACDGAPKTQQVYFKDPGVREYLQWATIEGPMLVEVHGNPFPTAKPFLDHVVAEELEASITYIAKVRLTTERALAVHPEYRVIVVMGAHKALDGQTLCVDTPPRMDPGADPMRMVAVFCRREEMLSLVHGSIRIGDSPDDKRFRDWIGQIGRDLLNPG